MKGTVKESRHGYRIPRKHLTPAWLRAFGKREEANNHDERTSPPADDRYTIQAPIISATILNLLNWKNLRLSKNFKNSVLFS
ncbi:hypothetical protein [Fodinibius sp.]|uniref:hypothetical protein n=1 Tax=Fodinibius sp. TaxID=1872440 RepID=UPI002ACDCAFE|nr:hypothetical protein [Fodinibius sp.]